MRVEPLLRHSKGEDGCRALAQRSLPAADPYASGRAERRALARLSGLALWRASAVGSDRMGAQPAARTSVALAASAASLQVGYRCAGLTGELAAAAEHHASLDEAVGGAVRLARELSGLVVRRTTLRGLLREQEHRLEVALREQTYGMKREAMLGMVESGMLPIELKVATLAAAREEEALNELHSEARTSSSSSSFASASPTACASCAGGGSTHARRARRASARRATRPCWR